MGNLRFAAALLFVAACGNDHAQTQIDAAVDAKMIDAKEWMDAPPPTVDTSCMSNAAPAAGSAPDALTLSGTVTEVDIQGTTPSIDTLAGATLNACVSGAANCTGPNKYAGPIDSATDGTFALSGIDTTPSNDPINGYISVTHTGDRPTYVFPPQAVNADLADLPVFVFTTDAFTALNLFASGGQQTANGNLVVIVTDCANNPVDGANIVVKRNGAVVSGLTDFDLGAFSSMAAGLHVVFDVGPGTVEVNATVGTLTLQPHDVDVFAGGSTMTLVRPGYL